jgi:hypothetical protein
VRISRATSTFAVRPHQNPLSPLNLDLKSMFSICSYHGKHLERKRGVGRFFPHVIHNRCPTATLRHPFHYACHFRVSHGNASRNLHPAASGDARRRRR